MVYEIPAVSETFTPFLMSAGLSVPVDLPPKDLGSVPIPSVPGASLRLSVEGDQIAIGLQGHCAKTDGLLSQFQTMLNTSGTTELAATLVVEIPVLGSKKFGPFAIEVPIPASEAMLDMGTFSNSGSPGDAADPCTTGGGAGNGNGAGDGNAPLECLSESDCHPFEYCIAGTCTAQDQ